MIENIHWLGHASFRIDDEKTVYIDPWKLRGSPLKADLILITHDHYDHCSPDDVAKIAKEGTVIVTVAAAAGKLKGDARIVKPGDRLTAAGIPIEVVPAYNVGKKFHPKRAGYVGFIITVGGQRIYHAGDTDLIPEMEDIQADITLLPVGGTYTMTAEEAAKAANKIKPQVAVPMHYGDIVGSAEDAQRFQELAQVEVAILPQE
ncbi:MAG: MBL fold metallo-hydrolase [Chloroflexota bacterium]|nr:MBL fold metallo-hydrolase [Chloroflexota bacterium]